MAGDIIEACAILRSVYSLPVKVKASKELSAFDDKAAIEKDYEGPGPSSFTSILGLSSFTTINLQDTLVEPDELYAATP